MTHLIAHYSYTDLPTLAEALVSIGFALAVAVVAGVACYRWCWRNR